jgi:serine/threonine protein kinase
MAAPEMTQEGGVPAGTNPWETMGLGAAAPATANQKPALHPPIPLHPPPPPLPSCADLVRWLLTIDVSQRPTAKQALQHRWLATAPDEPLGAPAAEGVHQMAAAKRLRRTAVHALVKALAISDMEELLATFQHIDTDGRQWGR